MNEVMNGSAGLSVISFRRSTGSGSSSQWMICARKAYASPKVTAIASRQRTIRERSSSRCSTSVASSPCRRRRGSRTG